MRLRARTPHSARMLYRFVRSFRSWPASGPLPDDLLRDCRFCSSRIAMLDLLPRGGRVAELGTQRGDFARQILARNTPAKLHLIDIDFTLFDKSIASDSRVKCHHGLTDTTVTQFQDAYFDWIYIDAEHSYEAVMADAKACVPKLKPGGYLVFNDFGHIDLSVGRYGVHRAVVEFATETRWPFRFFAYQEGAMYDVALQKPATA
jgi:hypothetical protein